MASNEFQVFNVKKLENIRIIAVVLALPDLLGMDRHAKILMR